MAGYLNCYLIIRSCGYVRTIITTNIDNLCTLIVHSLQHLDISSGLS